MLQIRGPFRKYPDDRYSLMISTYRIMKIGININRSFFYPCRKFQYDMAISLQITRNEAYTCKASCPTPTSIFSDVTPHSHLLAYFLKAVKVNTWIFMSFPFISLMKYSLYWYPRYLLFLKIDFGSPNLKFHSLIKSFGVWHSSGHVTTSEIVLCWYSTI